MRQRGTFGKLGNRKGARLGLAIAAILRLAHRDLECVLEDVSRLGARLSVRPIPAAGMPAILRFADIETIGTIVWATGNRCALRFDKPLTGDDMEVIQWITQNTEEYTQAQLDRLATTWR